MLCLIAKTFQRKEQKKILEIIYMSNISIPANAHNKVVTGENAKKKEVCGEAAVTTTNWRDYKWRRVVRYDWFYGDGTGDVDIRGYVYNTKQDAIDEVRRSINTHIDCFREEGFEVSDVYFENGNGQVRITEGCIVSIWVESNKLPW